jgi:ABC-type amino acid transport substrate-binding protein
MTRRLLIVVLIASILVPFAALPGSAAAESALDTIQRTKTLRVGWAVVHPYIFRDPKNNEITGFSIDLMRDMAGALGDGVKLQMVEDSWATLAAGLQANKFDIVPLLAVTLPRAMAVGSLIPTRSTDSRCSPPRMPWRKRSLGRISTRRGRRSA